MKKILCIIIALMLCISLAGCKSKEARTTEKLINDIGTVTLDSGEAISIAEQSYAALSPDDKSAVSEAKQRLDSYREEYNTLVALDEVDDALKGLTTEIAINDIEVEFDSENRVLTIPCVLDVDDAQLKRLELYNRGEECADTAKDFAEEIEGILSAHQVKDIQVVVQLLHEDGTTVFTEVTDGKVTKNIIQDYTNAKPSTRENTDFALACWGDNKETVLNYIKEPLWDLGETDISLFDQTIYKKSADVQYQFNSADQLYEVACLFNQDSISAANFILEFDNIKKAISNDYGEPIEDKIHQLSFLANYADASVALQLGYTAYRTIWETDTTDIYLIMSQGDSYKIGTVLFYCSKNIPED